MTEKCLKLLPAKLRREISELSFPEQIDSINDILKNEINSKRQMELQRIIHTRAERMVKSHPKGEKAGLNAFLAMDRNEMSSSVSLDGRLHSLKSHAENKVFDMMEEFKPTGIYTRDSVSLKQQSDFIDMLIDGNIDGIIDAKSPHAKVLNPALGPSTSCISIYIFHPAGSKLSHILRLVTYRPLGTF